MSDLKQLAVALDFGDGSRPVGRLVLQNRNIYFQYSAKYLRIGFNLSPIKLKWTGDIQRAETGIFDGLFGVFADALPDGWGRLLLDRSLSNHGIDIGSLSPLDRLAYVGKQGMGALTFQPEHLKNKVTEQFDLDKYALAAENILVGEPSLLLDELANASGSSGGARPKIVVGLSANGERMIAGPGPYPAESEAWLIKFRSSVDKPESARMEWAYYQMAKRAGLEMSPSKLITTAANNDYFATRRFDRPGGDKRSHLHSAAGLLHDNFRLTSLDYGHLMDAAFRLESSVEAYEKVLRLAAFNVFAHNLDDHSKNFSFLMDDQGRWSFAPAYDLTFSPSSFGHHATTVAGVSLRPGKEQLLELGRTFGVSRAAAIIDEVRSAVAQWPTIAADCGLGAAVTRQVANTIL